MTARRSIAVVGGGPRLTYLVRALAAQRSEIEPLHVTAYDASGAFGSGWVHGTGLDPGLLMNRLASEISFGPDSTCGGWQHADLPDPPTLTTYADRHGRDGEIKDGYPSRRLHGAALRASCSEAVELLRGRHRVDLVPAVVDAVEPALDGATITCQGSRRAFDDVVLLTGHGLPSPLHSADAVATVAEANGVVGLGATSIDLANAITSRRGSGYAGAPLAISSSSGMVPWPRPTKPSTVAGPPATPVAGGHLERLTRNDRPLAYASDLYPAVCSEIVAQHLLLGGAQPCEVALAADAVHRFTQRDPGLPPSAHASALRADCEALPGFAGPALHRWPDEFPWEALALLRSGTDARGAHWGVEAARRRLAGAESGYGVDAVATAFEIVLRDLRPVLVELTSTSRMAAAERTQAFTALVYAMNKLVNGPAPFTVRSFLSHVDRGTVVVATQRGTDGRGAVTGFVPPFTADAGTPLGNLVHAGVANVGLEYGPPGRRTARVAVDRAMRLDGPASNGRISVIGPAVDTGELLQASAMRPNCDHPVMRDITSWIDGSLRREHQ